MGKMYTEIHMTEQQYTKLLKWERTTGKDSKELIQNMLIAFIDELPEDSKTEKSTSDYLNEYYINRD